MKGKTMSDTISIFGIGNPLMDFVVNADDDFVKKLGAEKGTMNLISEEEKDDLLAEILTYKNIPGGSCANTIRGIAWLSEHAPLDKTVYSGAVGKDTVGYRYIELMEKEYGILPRIPRKKKATGTCIAIVTPDYERTMFTYLGACVDYAEEDIDYDLLKKAQIVHFAGYMWDTDNEKKAIKKAARICRENGITISFDLADPIMVQFHKEEFLPWIPDYVDILFGNKDEIAMITGKSGDNTEIILEAGKFSPLVVMKIGADGCIVNNKGDIFTIKGLKVKAIDTVGAGDSFASGFLYAYARKKDLKTCATMANRLAAHIVSVEGCDFSQLDQKEILLIQ
jgi:sugar/nucleoside kinase (ribokinase family)